MSAERPSLDIVIVDYLAGELLDACLASLAAHPPRHARVASVTVVDNAGGETSRAPVVPDGLPVTVIRNAVNRGFAAACNQGASAGRAPYVLFLNPDTRVLDGSLDVPVAFLESPAEAKTGIVGIQLVDDDGTPTPSCYAFPRPVHFVNKALGLDRVAPRRFPNGAYTGFSHRENRPVDQVMGAFFMVRRPLFDRLGGFDERYFVYFEEMDFSLRASQAGYRSMFLVGASAYHHGCGTTDRIRARRMFYSLRSRLKYGRRHFGAAGAALTWAVTLGVEPLTRIAGAVVRRQWSDVKETVRGYVMLAQWLAGERESA